MQVDLVVYHKGYKIVIKECGARNIGPDGNMVNKMFWFCSYVHGVENWEEHETTMGSGYEVTYAKDNVVGFDTAHMYNEDMSEAGKLMDAIRQALCFINELIKEKNHGA